MPPEVTGTPPVVLIGANGYGRNHLRRLAALAGADRIRLAGIVDVRPLDEEQRDLAGNAPFGTDAAEMIARVRPAVVVIATPIHTHADLALLAFRAGAHVLVEKPPTPALADFDRLVEAQREAGVACQVGFQASGSAAAAELQRQIRDGELGDVVRVGVAGVWSRNEAYYARSGWAGRRRLDGVPVTDGAVTNPFAHAVAMALVVDGTDGSVPVRRVEVESYHSYPIEADDTSCVRVVSGRGATVTVAVTLCANADHLPYVVVEGTRGRAQLWYTVDRLVTAAGERTYGRSGLMENLLDHLADPGVPLFSPLANARAFTQVVEAIRVSPPVTEVPARYQEIEGEPPARRRILRGIDDLVPEAAAKGRLYSEMGVAWATAQPFEWHPERAAGAGDE